MQNKTLLAYAMDFVSFLMERTNSNIKRVVLFGSVARGEASEESDLDLFIDILGNKKSIEKEVKKIREEFLNSKRYNSYWLLKDIRNEIKPMVGRLDEWKDLKNSIISNGILLFGRFEEVPKKAKHKSLLSWENVKPESRRVLLSKRLFGYKKDKKSYDGLLKKYEGEKISKGSIAVPTSNENIFLKLFKDMKIAVRIRKVLEYK